MNYSDLSDKVKHYVISLYKKHNTPYLLYHNLKHTKRVVERAEEISAFYRLEDRDLFIVKAAAWFHDTGYLSGSLKHEEKGASNAAAYLEAEGLDQETIGQVQKVILATQVPQVANNLLEEILCDADLYHLGAEEFDDNNKLLRKEMQLVYQKKIDKELWLRNTIALFRSHQYQTTYCRQKLDATKQQNLKMLEEKLREQAEPEGNTENKDLQKSDAADKKAGEKPGRGIETMFRISSGNHQRLSDMADNKAHIMITVNSIILSAVISLLLSKLDSNSYLTFPTFIILMVSLLAIVFSILATRPTLSSGVFSQKDIDDKKVNLLFFGNFYRMPLDQYAVGMNKMMDDREFLYGMLIKDVYSQGVVLGKKYRLLRISYNIFMYGLIIAVLAFVVASFFAD